MKFFTIPFWNEALRLNQPSVVNAHQIIICYKDSNSSMIDDKTFYQIKYRFSDGSIGKAIFDDEKRRDEKFELLCAQLFESNKANSEKI